MIKTEARPTNRGEIRDIYISGTKIGRISRIGNMWRAGNGRLKYQRPDEAIEATIRQRMTQLRKELTLLRANIHAA